jgi:hypothetical protein
MNSMALARRLGLLLLVLQIGCYHGTEPYEDLDVQLSTGSAVLTPRAPVTVAVTVTNRGTRTVAVAPHGCLDPFVVISAAGVELDPPVRICSAIALPLIELEPGQSTVFRRNWSGMEWSSSIGRSQFVLAPGNYRLSGRVQARGGIARSSTVPVRVEF